MQPKTKKNELFSKATNFTARNNLHKYNLKKTTTSVWWGKNYESFLKIKQPDMAYLRDQDFDVAIVE